MRKHATDRLASALAHNSALDLEKTQAESGACRWESDIFQGSNSKSAYLSKLSNAVSQIKRASELAQLGVPATAWVPDHQATSSGQNVAERGHSPDQPTPTSQNNASPLGVRSCQNQLSSQQAVSEQELRQLMQELDNASGTCLSTCRWMSGL